MSTRPIIRIALIEGDPLRVVGFHALLESEPDLELISVSLLEIARQQNIDLALVGQLSGQKRADILAILRVVRPNLPVIVIGSGTDDSTILDAIVSGAKGYVFDGAPPQEFSQAIRIVSQGSVWAPRHVISMFIENVLTHGTRMLPAAVELLTDREREVLGMLVAGLSNREIGVPLGIEPRTVKAHVSKMMRKVGVQNRIALSVHAITHSLVTAGAAVAEGSGHLEPLGASMGGRRVFSIRGQFNEPLDS
jgi:DNA-binding NarL/FixJ family response regulator